MPFINRAGRRARSQRGVSLIESVVASALMGIGVVAGLTAWDTASMSAGQAVRLAWANCIVRSEMDAILSAAWDPSGYAVPDPFNADHTVQVAVIPVPARGPTTAWSDEQRVTVRALDPQSNAVLAQVTVLKTRALSGLESIGGTLSDVRLGCPAR
jgi:prepilin-type N-terminal cleavage/methylation domain-containing protein